MQPWYFNHRTILSTAFILRLTIFIVVLIYPERSMLADSDQYMTISENMYNHGAFSINDKEPFFPDMIRTPFYPGILYLFQWTGNASTVVLILQLVVSFLSCYYVIRLTQKITGNKNAAAISGWFMAFDIPSIVLTGFLLTETFFTFLLLLFLWHVVVYFENKKIQSLLLSSAFLGLALLCRPIALFLPVWIIICFLLFFRKKISFTHVALFVLPVTILTGSWIMRNYLAFEKPFFTRIGTFNLAWFQASMIKAEAENTSIEDARWNLFSDAAGKMNIDPVKDPIRFYSMLGAESRNVILDNPVIAVKNMAIAEANLLFRPSNGYVAHLFGITHLPTIVNPENVRESIVIRIAFVFQIIFLFLLYIGCILLFLYRKHISNKESILVIIFIFAYFLIPGTGPEMEARFRIPLLPMLAVLSATGWITFINRNKSYE